MSRRTSLRHGHVALALVLCAIPGVACSDAVDSHPPDVEPSPGGTTPQSINPIINPVAGPYQVNDALTMTGGSARYDYVNKNDGTILDTATTQSYPFAGAFIIPVADLPYGVNFPAGIMMHKLTTTLFWTWPLPAGIPGRLASYPVDVYFDGARVAGGTVDFPIFGGNTAIVWATVPMPPPQWTTVTVSVTAGNTQFNSTPQMFFELRTSPFLLDAPTYRSASCTNCHSLGTSDAISNFHVSRGAWGAPNPAAQPGNATVCNGCHAPFIGTGNWFSPPASADMDWSTKSLYDVCVATFTHTGGYDGFIQHISWDPRLLWSFNGALPGGKTEPPPWPGSAYSFQMLQEVIGWADFTTPETACKNLQWVPY
jgi:hypothetical protein